MKGVIMQPHYLPWLGYFELISKADIFVFYDHVQFEKQSWQQRNRILTLQGQILMLTVPVNKESGLIRRINEVTIDTRSSFFLNHLASIKMNYAKCPHFSNLFPELESIYLKEHKKLIDLEVDIIEWAIKKWNFKTCIVFSSTLYVDGSKVEALIDVCKKLGITHYYSPKGSQIYIEENNLFIENNIEISYQNFTPPIYSQIRQNDFVSHLSFIDYIMNHGFSSDIFQ